ncbi:alcohol oxidase [Panus rudis PR-1116 ss-1]|nr:alcohol oxidase [Panus rudis PR-1116 ss-1]
MPIVTSVDEFLSAKLDYLVIGGGTSGLVVAARLTEDPNTTVGVLEAGNDHANVPEVVVPGMMARVIHNPEFDWSFYTVPEKYCNDRKVLQSRGKGLGGSSAINFLASVRPAKNELDVLEELGNPGWNWDSTLKYMKKSERLQVPDFTSEQKRDYAVIPDPNLHGTDGPIAKSFPPHVTPFHSAFLDAFEKHGLPRNPENSGGNPVGALLFPTSVDSKTATRSSSASGYLAPNASRPNLLVLTGAHAAKILLEDGKSGLKRATGAEFIKDEKTYTVKAAKEVILSAGSFQSPQLLELSGIGDKDVLSANDIECKIDLPGVGENLQDHSLAPSIIEVDQSVESWEVLFSPEGLAKHQELYKQQKGILAGIPSSLFAFFPANVFASPEDIQRWKSLCNLEGSPAEVFEKTKPSVKRGLKKQYEILSKWVDDPAHPMALLLTLNGHFPVPGMQVDHSKRFTTLLLAYTHPFARGTVHITSKSPLDPPAIKQNYLSNPVDLEVLVKIMQFMNKVYETDPVKKLFVKRVLPPEGVEGDEALREYVKNALATVHHPVGTCAMLPKEDGGVVNNKLLVYGTENLRVIDCSVIPLEISSNVQTLAYAVGEKGADIIKGVA